MRNSLVALAALVAGTEALCAPMRTSTGRPCPTMRSNVVLSRSCMLKRGTSVRGRAGRKADQAPGRRWAGRHEAPALPLHLPGAHAAPKPLLSACCGHEDAVVGSGRRGEREHESGDAPAQQAEWCRWSAWLWLLRRSEGGRPTRLICGRRACVAPGDKTGTHGRQIPSPVSSNYLLTYSPAPYPYLPPCRFHVP